MLLISTKSLKLLAVGWLIFITVLFFLPGSAFPKQDWLATIFFDKWVHFGLFAVLLFLWRFYLPSGFKYSTITFMAAVVYGWAVELVQHYCIANRSFDVGDLAADLVGAGAGLLVWRVYKKIDPCRNRGRNQN